MITLRVYLRASRMDVSGQSVIYFIVGDEWVSSTLKVAKLYWDADNSCILKKHPKYYIINPTFQLYKSRAEQCISNLQTAGKPFNRNYFENFIFSGADQADNPCFLKLIDEYSNMMNVGWGRVKQFKGLKKDIQKVLNAPKILDINFNFTLKFQQHLRTKEKPNNENTISHKLRAVKAIVHFAQKKGLLDKDPLAMIKVKDIKGDKNHLKPFELEILEALYDAKTLQPIYQNILKYFLFSCYTGLRYSDIVSLKYYEIKNDCVVTVQEKTDKPVVVPLISKAKALLATGTTGNCFKTNSNQVTNRYLKTIIKDAGIDKKITYHCSRHTFGTLSIYWGIPMEVVAELMGVDYKTVKIYAQIVDDVKTREMLKWERKVG
jgi:site-specific recombinase XerD